MERIRSQDSVLTEELRRLEVAMTQPDIRRSREAMLGFLSEEFVEFGGSGRVFHRESILELLAAQPPVEIGIEGFEARWLAPGLALATYRAGYADPSSGVFVRSLRSSIWRRDDDRWRIVFHQGTTLR